MAARTKVVRHGHMDVKVEGPDSILSSHSRPGAGRGQSSLRDNAEHPLNSTTSVSSKAAPIG